MILQFIASIGNPMIMSIFLNLFPEFMLGLSTVM